MSFRICLVAIFATTAALAADIPVRQVVLYKHGIGYFERSGTLAPGESARFDFKTSEMNDVLKSLTVVDKNGGKISGLRFDSKEPLDHKLTDFPFHIGDKQPLSALLDQMKGSRLELRLPTETVTGAIVSARIIVAGDNPARRDEREQITLLTESGDLRNFDLAAAVSIRFVDPLLQEQFKDYLSTLTQARSKEKRSLYIHSENGKSRQLSASYIIPMPLWKSSYRLILNQMGEPILEGWAIIDNTTGEDWNNVQLALMSGRPISFTSRLYEPRYINRPAGDLPEEQALAPTLHEGAVEEAKSEKQETERNETLKSPRARYDVALSSSAGAIAGGIGGGAGAGVGQGTSNRFYEGVAPREQKASMASSIESTAAARPLGELFEYRIPTPVTIRRNESTMVPFLQQSINGRKLLLYSNHASLHPMNAVEITNSTGKTLDGGPIAVLDSGAYAGEALMETLKDRDKRLISYAIDLGIRVTTKLDSHTTPVREIKFQRGVLTTRSSILETKTYTIRNVEAKPKILILEHPLRPEYKLVNLKPSETTATAYRFEVKVPSGAGEKFSITEERNYESTSLIAQMTPDVLFTYVQNKALSETARKQLQQILHVKRQLGSLGEELQQTESEINTLVRDQERIRQNLFSLNQVSGQQEQVQKYARQLTSQEGQLSSLREKVLDLKQKQAALDENLKAMIENVEF